MKAPENEKALLQGLAANDRKAVETIYKTHYKMVQALIVNNNGTAEDAKDIFQEAIVVLYEKAASGVFELHCQLKTYLYSVSRKLWLRRLQQSARYLLSDTEHDYIAVEEDTEAHERRDLEFTMMEKAINSIGEPCKSLLEAFYIQKRGMNEIATAFGYTNADNAKNQKYKCLMRLKKIFFTQYKTDKP
ncbi:MAG TPA: sigma-70 family RNA polymerase sigma factor [Chitinophagaceae bacterium]|nr:sigma-70 family RNA polymerase sigma factor [Chitinophagaceae bacterium]